MCFLIYIYIAIVFALNTVYPFVTIFMLKNFMKQISLYEKSLTSPIAGYPGITILTSLRGVSTSLEDGFKSLVKQDYYGPLQLIIAVENSEDPGYKIAEGILNDVAHDIEVKWVKDFKPEGGNPRTAKLVYISQFAKYDWIYWWAADNFANNDHLTRMMHKTGTNPAIYVSAIPVHVGCNTLGALFENIPLVWELPMVCFFNQAIKKPFVYGGSVLFHLSLFQKAGSLKSILNCLSEEVPMAREFYKAGGKGEIVPSLVWSRNDSQSLFGFYDRKVRLAMIGRLNHKEIFYLGLIFTVLWFPLFYLITGHLFFLYLLGLFLLVKIYVVYSYHVALKLPKRQRVWSVIMILYEFISLIICINALFRKRLNWAGDILIIGSGGMVKREA